MPRNGRAIYQTAVVSIISAELQPFFQTPFSVPSLDAVRRSEAREPSYLCPDSFLAAAACCFFWLAKSFTACF
jgi:hypothetical protein